MKINNFVLLDFNDLKQFVIKYVYFITSPGLKISSLYPLNSYDQVLKCKILQIFVKSFVAYSTELQNFAICSILIYLCLS